MNDKHSAGHWDPQALLNTWTDIGQEVDGSWTAAKEKRSVRNRLPLVDASFKVRPTATEYVVCDGCDV